MIRQALRRSLPTSRRRCFKREALSDEVDERRYTAPGLLLAVSGQGVYKMNSSQEGLNTLM